ncbi:MAG: hypothetical protein CM15mV134_400 [uncultured marine virus]|nr:MAG: hypothetical protein CM15mV134_400 [uncultured marine virus]
MMLLQLLRCKHEIKESKAGRESATFKLQKRMLQEIQEYMTIRSYKEIT